MIAKLLLLVVLGSLASVWLILLYRVRPPIAPVEWLIEYAKRTPYFHLHHADGSIYMERYWLVPGVHTATERTEATLPLPLWRAPLRGLIQRLGMSVRLHVIHTPDVDRAFHDHPWSFLSLILRGAYYETMPLKRNTVEFTQGQWPFPTAPDRDFAEPFNIDRREPGDIGFRSFQDRHRIVQIDDGPVVTLFVTFRKQQSWGFFTPKGKIWWWEFESSHNVKPITERRNTALPESYVHALENPVVAGGKMAPWDHREPDPLGTVPVRDLLRNDSLGDQG